MPIRHVRDVGALEDAVALLAVEPAVGLDIETTLGPEQTLCLVQLAGSGFTALVDALALADLSPLEAVLGDERVVKVIHDARFERRVLRREGLPLQGVFDTLRASEARYGRRTPGGHSLAALCARELGFALDKRAQTSDWTRRPLSPAQVAYAALDAELLLPLRAALAR